MPETSPDRAVQDLPRRVDVSWGDGPDQCETVELTDSPELQSFDARRHRRDQRPRRRGRRLRRPGPARGPARRVQRGAAAAAGCSPGGDRPADAARDRARAPTLIRCEPWVSRRSSCWSRPRADRSRSPRPCCGTRPTVVPVVPADEPGGDLEKEFKQEQIETSTPPRADLAELVAEIRAGRARTDGVARQAGARIAALATAPQVVESTVLPDRRAYAIRAEFGQTARDQLTCGCHVHVSIDDEDEGVRILDHLRPWNAVLLALSGNSPSWQGSATGYASYRSQVWGRWPTAGPTAPFGDAAGYRAVIDDLLRHGRDPRRGDGLLRRPPVVAVPDGRGARRGRVPRRRRRRAAGRARARARGDRDGRADAPAAHRAAAGRDVAGRPLGPHGRPGQPADRAGRCPPPRWSASWSSTCARRWPRPATSSGSSGRSPPCCGAATARSSSSGWRAEGADDDEVVRRAVDRTLAG